MKHKSLSVKNYKVVTEIKKNANKNFKNDGIPVNHSRIFSPKEYDKLINFEANRKLCKKNVQQKIESIKKHGQTHAILVIELKGMKGVYLIIDGQHRFAALVYLGLPIYTRICKCDTIEDAHALMVSSNNNLSNWKLGTYITSYYNLASKCGGKITTSEDYGLLKETIENYPTIQDSVIVMVMLFKGRQTSAKFLKEGFFEIEDYRRAKKILNYILDFQEILPKSRIFNEAVANLLMKNYNYYSDKHTKMLNKVNNFLKKGNSFGHKTENDVRKKLFELYNNL